MAEALISLDLSSVNTNVLLKELGGRLESYYNNSTEIKEWIKAQYLDLVYNDNNAFQTKFLSSTKKNSIFSTKTTQI